MNRIRRLALTGLATMLAIVLLFGCSSGKTSSPAENEGGDTRGSAENEGGDTRGSITVTLYDRGNVPPEAGTVDDNIWTRWINEHGPVNVDFIPFPRFEQVQKLNLLFAAGEAPDLILEYDRTFFDQLYAQKQLLPLDELIEEHSTTYKQLTEKYPQLLTLGRMDDGKIYLFGRVLGAKTNDYMLIRKDWLDKLRLDMPKTTEELFQVAKAFRDQDPDGNGEKDTFGINISRGSAEYIVNAMFNNLSWIVEDGRLVNPNIGEQAKAAAEFQKRLFEYGIVDKDFLTDKTGEKAKQDWVSGKLGIYLAGSGVDNQRLLEAYKSLLKNDPSAVIEVLPLPEGPFGAFNPGFKAPIQMTGAINAAAKDPVSIMKYVDFLAETDTTMTLKNGIEGVHYTLDEEGIAKPIDPDKNKADLVGILDLHILSSFGTLPKKEQLEVKLNPDIPEEKRFAELIEAAHEVYFNPKNEYAVPIANLPSLPADLQIIAKNTETIQDIWRKSIVGGNEYTPEKALVEVQKLWKSAGGQKIEEFYNNWFTEKRDSVIFNKDIIYQINQINQ